MKSKMSTGIAILILWAALALAQKAPQVPKPGPELAKLSYFLGDWKLDGVLKANRSTPGEHFVNTTHYEWMSARFFLVAHSIESSLVQNGKGLTIYGYDPNEKPYIFYAFTSMGRIESAKGKVDGNIWTWNNENKNGR